MANTTIYALCDPITGEIRYIGKTQRHVRARLARSYLGQETRGWLRTLWR